MDDHIKNYKYVTYIGKDNDMIIYKVSKNMIEDVKYSLEFVHRTRNYGRNRKKNKTDDQPKKSEQKHLPVNVEFEKNSPSTLNLIEYLKVDDENNFIIKLTPAVSKDLKYGISLVYKNRKKKAIIYDTDKNPNIKKRPGPKQIRLQPEEFDYNIIIPCDF